MAAVLSVLKIVSIVNLVVKNREKIIYVLVVGLLFIVIMCGAIISALVPSIEFGETIWEKYENGANIMGGDLQHIIVFDQARTWNKFDDVNPYGTAVYFADVNITEYKTEAQYMLINPTTPEDANLIVTYDMIPEEDLELWHYVGNYEWITSEVNLHGVHIWNYLVEQGYISPHADVDIYLLIDGLEQATRQDVVYEETDGYMTYELKAMTLFDFRVSAYLNEREAEYAFMLIHNNIVNGLTGDTSIFELYGTFIDVIGHGFFTHPNPDLYFVNSEFGYRFHPIYHEMRQHNGIDLINPGDSMGLPIGATADGVVKEVVYRNTGLGYRVVIEHIDSNEQIWESVYGHCSFILVSEGQVVEKGQVIAGVGNTGGSTGAHLHFEIKKNGVWVNPRYQINFD